MEITDDLIRKFFNNECEPPEFEAVMRYLELHPEAVAHFSVEDWNAAALRKVVADHDHAEVLAALKTKLFGYGADSGHTTGDFQPSATGRLRRLSWTAVAASLLLVICGWFWMTTHKSGGKGIAGTGPRSAADGLGKAGAGGAEQAAAAWVDRRNTSGKTETIVLPDGSHVKLFAHSALRYTDSFGIVCRASWLEGEAIFTVEKDKDHPFTVYSGALATTALGTSFGVRAPATADMITVKLFTGRVVVRSAAPFRYRGKDVYLSPGEQVLFDNHSLLARVSRFVPDSGNVAGKEADQQGLVFNNSPLKIVFTRLSLQYHTTISYKHSDIAGMNFTGSMSTDSLPDFLRLLATMNDLDIREQPTGYIITRHKDK
jgi:ferric-dicitrate binding protein FerR (iron transport regulator)